MRVGEIETTWADEPDRKEWIVVDRHDGWVSIGREHIRYDGERVSDQDAGIVIDDSVLDAVVALLKSDQAATVARLTAERDEARAEVARLRTVAGAYSIALRELIGEWRSLANANENDIPPAANEPIRRACNTCAASAYRHAAGDLEATIETGVATGDLAALQRIAEAARAVVASHPLAQPRTSIGTMARALAVLDASPIHDATPIAPEHDARCGCQDCRDLRF